jgi:hypothetical protein
MPDRVHFLRDAALVFASDHDSGRHAHRALQLTLSLDEDFRWTDGGGRAQQARFRAFAPHEVHRVVARGRLAYLFIDAGPRAFERWSARQVVREPSPALRESLTDAATRRIAPDAAQALATAWEAECLPDWRIQTTDDDPRLRALIEAIDRDPTQSTNHRRLAEAAHLAACWARRPRVCVGPEPGGAGRSVI